MSFFTSVADIDQIIADLPPVDGATQNKVAARQSQLTKPPGSLGKLEDIAIWMAGWQRTEHPDIAHGQCLVFAGNHGVVAQAISPFPAEVTAHMVKNAETGGSAINQLCQVAGLELTVTPMQLHTPTRDITIGPAMDTDEVLAAMNAGANAIADSCDYLIVGDMGVGKTTAAAALCLGRFGADAKGWVGPGMGVDDDGIAHKAAIIEKAAAFQHPVDDHAVALLAAFGGYELAAIAGAVLAARSRSIPVMLDGFSTTAAAATLTAKGQLDILDHAMISHMSPEPGHLRLAVALRKVPIIDFKMRLGEASGAAVASLLVRAACAMHNGMATFAEVGVTADSTP